jgi:hypothetical protein
VFLILTIPLNQYDTFVKKIDTASPAYEFLRKGVFERQIKGDHFERVMNVMCDAWEAETLLDLANQVYPDIAPEIVDCLVSQTWGSPSRSLSRDL